VDSGSAHEDNATVVGVGVFSGVSVTDTNGYFATTTDTTQVLGETGSLGSGTTTTTAELANTGARVVGLLWLFAGLAAGGGLLIFAGRRRNPFPRS
jgi:LPXTG-motif cell wall-anchored protein